ncbi:ArsR/SmtB family transcription factor [Streptomyces sp. SPB074]|uniref:ArsR/SmtB family transcription factor n=1 Tax=Streptomyces sp. (strain SPB074) TaxID=465543 RepID=UPI00017F148D|nr:helix-turn-helix domain-containing protein [Streptomyces sp. SPB074]EDY46463.1 ArsR family transcriptional regulator [Streptomyces sp. SPB074]
MTEDLSPAERAIERTTRHLDARSLRALAHPLRLQLLNSLRRGGPATASQLGKELGESSGATSYHLRQLAEHGFVEDDPEHGKGRERWWRAVPETINFNVRNVDQNDPEIRGASDVFLHELASTHYRETASWVADRDRWRDTPWEEAGNFSDMTLYLSAAELTELSARLLALIAEYDTREEAQEGQREVRVHLHALPVHREART